MGMFVFGLVLVLVGVGVLVLAPRQAVLSYMVKVGARVVGGVLVLVGTVVVVSQSYYTQDAGEAKVQVSWTGELVGQTTSPGIHLKAPWVKVLTFDVRNNVVAYVGSGTVLPNYSGNTTTGPQITFQDKEGVSGNIDLTVRYSINGDAVLDIYTEFRTQDAFVNRVVSETVRSVARNSVSTRNTIEVYNERAQVGAEIQKALEEALGDQGVTIESVNLQEIRYSPEVVARFDEAQAARIAVDRAEAEQETARVAAETLVVKSQGEADARVVAATGEAEANRILSESLTEEVLQQRYIDALRAGTVFVVPEGSTPLVTTQK